MTKTVKVAEYRNETDHLFRLVNVDYHACVSAREVERWKETTSRVLIHVQGLQCARANDYDREQLAKAVTAAKAQLVAADARIVQLQSKRPANTVQRADEPLMENALLALLGLADNVGAQLLNIGPSTRNDQEREAMQACVTALKEMLDQTPRMLGSTRKADEHNSRLDRAEKALAQAAALGVTP